MPNLTINAPHISGISTCVPSSIFDNSRDTTEFTKEEIQKVVSMAGVAERRTVSGDMRSKDLCCAAASRLLETLDWHPDSIDALIMVTQTPDYFLPPTSCLVHRDLGLSENCAAFDLNQACSGYIYGLWTASNLFYSRDIKRVLFLHGDTPTMYTSGSDRSVALLFGDAGSATALEMPNDKDPDQWPFILRTDGKGFEDLIIPAGGFRDRFCEDREEYFIKMNGSNVFNFTIRVVPPLVNDTLALAGLELDEIDYYIFHQSNRFIMKHLFKKCGLEEGRTPIILDKFGNTSGASIPLTITQVLSSSPIANPLKLMLIGYGGGLSWGSAVVNLGTDTKICHVELDNDTGGTQ